MFTPSRLAPSQPRSLLKRLAAADPKLEDQARRAATSVALNIAEATERRGKDQRNRYRISLGSAAEVAAALDVAVALGYIVEHDAADALALADRIRAMTYRLSHSAAGASDARSGWVRAR